MKLGIKNNFFKLYRCIIHGESTRLTSINIRILIQKLTFEFLRTMIYNFRKSLFTIFQ